MLKSKATIDKEELINLLRNKAEKVLNETREKKDTGSPKQDIDMLLQELQVHQIELEMQNDELKITNEQLELQQLKFSRFFNLAPVGYFIVNHAGIIEEVNNAGVSLLSNGRAGLLARPLSQFISPDYFDTYYLFFLNLRTGQGRQSCQLKMKTRNDHEFHAHIEGTSFTAGIPDNIACYIAVIDITERIESGQQLAETKERLELSLEASSAGTWELDLETMAFYLDDFNYHMCALPDTGFDGKYQSFIDLIHPDDRQMVDQQFRISINQEKEIDVVCRMINKLGRTCYAGVRGHVIDEASQGKRLVGIMIDITEKRRIEEETARLKHNQQQAITLATLNAEENERRRISDALHDSVSQLLYGIKMKLGIQVSASSKAKTDILELIDQAIQETRNISFELAPSILTDFGLPATIEELAKRLSTPKMQIRTSVTGFNTTRDTVLETTIFRIIQELINNCMKHAAASLVNVRIKKTKQITIKVEDNGHGFDYSVHEKSTSGSGLRSIKNRLSLYNGNLAVTSAPGMGTVIEIVLNNKSAE